MRRVTIVELSEETAIEKCLDMYGWSPDAVREVDKGDEMENNPDYYGYMLFESAEDAELWDRQL